MGFGPWGESTLWLAAAGDCRRAPSARRVLPSSAVASQVTQEVPKAAARVSRGHELRVCRSFPKNASTDTASTQDVRPASDTAGHPSDHLEPHTVYFLAAALLIRSLLTARAYPLVCILQQAQYCLRLVSGFHPSMPTHMR